MELAALEQDVSGVTAILTLGDGAHSTVRHQLGLEFDGAEYEDRLLAADVLMDWELPSDGGHIFLGSDGTITAFPFPEPRKWRLAVFGGNEAGDRGTEATSLTEVFGLHLPAGEPVISYPRSRRAAPSRSPGSSCPSRRPTGRPGVGSQDASSLPDTQTSDNRARV